MTSEWQPIESAPRGTTLLVYAPGWSDKPLWAFRRDDEWFDYHLSGDGGVGRLAGEYAPTHWLETPDPPKPTPERRPYDPAVDGAPGWSKQVPSLGTADTPEELAEQHDIYAWHLASIPGDAMVITPMGSVKSEDRGTEKVAEMKAAWEARQ